MLLPIFYLPPIYWFSKFLNEDQISLEQWENFPKQTYRNRTNIYGANGKLSLVIPIKHTGKRQMKDIEISYAENWQKIHWKSIKTAYQSSPYFEFYEDKLGEIYNTDEPLLAKFNLRALEIIQDILKTEKSFSLTEEYIKICDNDFRGEFSAKNPSHRGLSEYYQTFTYKMGFIEDLSIVDLLCNKGPETINYLKTI